MLLWQEALPKPHFDVRAYRKNLQEAVGEIEMAKLESMPSPERESMRFSVERLFGESQNVERDARELIQVLHEERLRRELTAATLLLAEAEKGRNTEEISRLEAHMRLLTAQIAELHKKV